MITIAVCDDEPFMSGEISKKVENYFSARSVPARICRFSDGNSLLNSEERFDMIFLDIRMDGIDGMETARALRQRGYQGFLIFATVLEEYVFDSFEVQAWDYLLKPLDDSRLERMLNRLLPALCGLGETALMIRRGNECRTVPFDEILYCEVIDRKVYLHASGETIDYYERIGSLEEKLDSRFFRCHRSYLVNLKYVRGFRNGSIFLNNGENIPVSRSCRQELSNRILLYMKEWRH